MEVILRELSYQIHHHLGFVPKNLLQFMLNVDSSIKTMDDLVNCYMSTVKHNRQINKNIKSYDW
jgi:hypothetical protein